MEQGFKGNTITTVLFILAVSFILGVVCLPTSQMIPGETSGQIYYISWGCIIGSILGGIAIILMVAFKTKLLVNFPTIVSWVLIFMGGYQAIWGLSQLYGFTHSNHSLFNLTGSFFNPGPYSGYLAMVIPVCLHEWLKLRSMPNKTIVGDIFYYIALAVMLLMLCVLPAGMSRSAWIAAAVSSLFVLSIHFSWIQKFKNNWIHHKKKIIFFSLIGLILVVLGASFIYSIKKDSANGRLFMWKISCMAIMEKPFTGHGINSFASAYGNAQEKYFASGNFTEQEELVAGSPEYAFNEYLHFAIEWGIPLLIVVLSIITYAFIKGLKKKYEGICGFLISVLIFSLSSYPIQLPVFVMTFFVLLSACEINVSSYGLGAFIFFYGIAGVYLNTHNVYKECCNWAKSRMLYHAGVYESVTEEYAELYPALKTRPAFLFEYGHAHHKSGNYNLSNEIMFEATQYSCDPMIFNIIGKNFQNMGEYKQAEHWLLRSVNRLPGRIYPYYLLAKLYAEPGFYQPEKLKEMADVVLTKNPKVQSTAIKQMRQEVKKLLSETVNSE